MNLRTVTIWTTGLALFLTMVLPIRCFWVGEGITFCLLLWLFSGSPLVVSLVIACKLKFVFGDKLEPAVAPNLVLLFSTIAYAIWYAYMLYCVFTSCDGLAVFGLFGIAIFSLPVMFPVWIIALILDAYRPHPGTARGIAASSDNPVVSVREKT